MRADLTASFGELLMAFRTRRRLTQATLAAALGTHRNTIGRWERGEMLPDSKGVVLELARHLFLDDQEARLLLEASFTAPAPYWSVPFPRNPCFSGREAVLELLHTRLSASRHTSDAHILALPGLGGMGKTQIAVEYAYRYALEYRAVFWLTAESAEKFASSMQHIACELRLPECQVVEKQQEAVLRWLTAHTGWLLICDQVEDLELLSPVLPLNQQGTLLITTRHQAVGMFTEAIDLLPMNIEEGGALLLRRTRRQAHGTSTEVRELVTLLGGLPLALDQAGAYMEETGCTVADYIQRWRAQRHSLLARRGSYGGTHPSSVAETLQRSLDLVGREHPAAVNLLQACAFLSPEAIAEDMLQRSAAYLGDVLAPLVADPYQFDLMLAALRSASLITRHTASHMLSIHPLLQVVLRDQMKPDTALLWKQRVVRMVNAAFPQKASKNRMDCERYLVQARACVALIEQGVNDFPEAAELLYKTGCYLFTCGQKQEAEQLLVEARTLREKLDRSEKFEL